MYTIKTTAQIKKALVAEFKHKFSVTKGKGTASHWIEIHWVDGPTEAMVRKFTRKFNDSDRDDTMTDLWCGSQYTSESRDVSAEKHIPAILKICEKYGLPKPEYNTFRSWTGKYDKISIRENYGLTQQQLNNIHPCNFYTAFLSQEVAKIDFRELAVKPYGENLQEQCVASAISDSLPTVNYNDSKNGIEITFNDKPLDAIRTALKDAGFRWHRKNGFWYGEDTEENRTLAAQLCGISGELLKLLEQARDPRIAQFRKLADNMDAAINSKLNPATASQNLTPKRVRTIASMRQDGERMQKVQVVLRGVADDLEGGRQPPVAVHSKKDVERYVRADASWIKRYVAPPSEEEVSARKIAQLEAELVGCKIRGFFPTPRVIIDRMIELAEVNIDYPSILEPSAGKGDIADVLREKYPQAELEVCETNESLAKILKLKGYKTRWGDFMQYFTPPGGAADYIFMNPPFERLQDIDHVKHAYYSHLKPGGIIVAIMSEACFFRRDKKAAEFREWLDGIGAYDEKLDPGSFKGVGSFRQTGVDARIVVIRYV